MKIFMYIFPNMKLFKKISWLILCGVMILCVNSQFAEWLRWPASKIDNITINTDSNPKIDNKDIGDNPISQWSEHMWQKSDWILQPNSPTDNYETRLAYVLALIQITTNWLLWILATVALVYMLYNGALILFSGSENKNLDKGKKWIKTAAIAMAGIWISWLIVSAIIWFINTMT